MFRLLSRVPPAAAAATCGVALHGVAQPDSARCEGWKFWQKKTAVEDLAALSGTSPARKATLADLGGEPMKEPRTGVLFPAANVQGSLKLAGCGVRSKYGIVPVYAVGLYAHPDFKVAEGADVLAALRAAVANDKLTNEIRLTLVRDVGAATFVKALEEQVLPRSSKQQCDLFSTTCQAGLADTIKDKTTLVLRLKPDGTIDLLSEGALVASVQVPEVADALLDVYVGPDAVSPAARDSICAGLKAF